MSLDLNSFVATANAAPAMQALRLTNRGALVAADASPRDLSEEDAKAAQALIARFVSLMQARYGETIAEQAGVAALEDKPMLVAGAVKRIVAVAEEISVAQVILFSLDPTEGAAETENLDAAVAAWRAGHPGVPEASLHALKDRILENLLAGRPPCDSAAAMYEAVRAGQVSPLKEASTRLWTLMNTVGDPEVMLAELGETAKRDVGRLEAELWARLSIASKGGMETLAEGEAVTIRQEVCQDYLARRNAIATSNLPEARKQALVGKLFELQGDTLRLIDPATLQRKIRVNEIGENDLLLPLSTLEEIEERVSELLEVVGTTEQIEAELQKNQGLQTPRLEGDVERVRAEFIARLTEAVARHEDYDLASADLAQQQRAAWRYAEEVIMAYQSLVAETAEQLPQREDRLQVWGGLFEEQGNAVRLIDRNRLAEKIGDWKANGRADYDPATLQRGRVLPSNVALAEDPEAVAARQWKADAKELAASVRQSPEERAAALLETVVNEQEILRQLQSESGVNPTSTTLTGLCAECVAQVATRVLEARTQGEELLEREARILVKKVIDDYVTLRATIKRLGIEDEEENAAWLEDLFQAQAGGVIRMVTRDQLGAKINEYGMNRPANRRRHFKPASSAVEAAIASSAAPPPPSPEEIKAENAALIAQVWKDFPISQAVNAIVLGTDLNYKKDAEKCDVSDAVLAALTAEAERRINEEGRRCTQKEILAHRQAALGEWEAELKAADVLPSGLARRTVRQRLLNDPRFLDGYVRNCLFVVAGIDPEELAVHGVVTGGLNVSVFPEGVLTTLTEAMEAFGNGANVGSVARALAALDAITGQVKQQVATLPERWRNDESRRLALLEDLVALSDSATGGLMYKQTKVLLSRLPAFYAFVVRLGGAGAVERLLLLATLHEMVIRILKLEEDAREEAEARWSIASGERLPPALQAYLEHPVPPVTAKLAGEPA